MQLPDTAELRLLMLLCLFLLCSICNVNSTTSYVKPSEESASCPDQPCLMLNEYAAAVTQYFTDNTTFIFLPGYHHLDTPIRIENASGLAFRTMNSNVDLSTQVLFSPLANMTWAGCDEIAIHDLVFILSGNLDTTTHFSALVFIETNNCALSQLLFESNSTLQSTAVRTYSSRVSITNVTVVGAKSLLGAALFTYNSTINLFGENFFTNNTATQGGAMGFYSTVCTFNGNNYFIGNTAQYNKDYFSLFPDGGAVHCDSSVLSFNGSTTFQDNKVDIPKGSLFAYAADGGAMAIYSNSRVTFEQTADTLFTSNSAPSNGGAISISDSDISLQQGKVVFEKNYCSLSASFGGAIAGLSNANIRCIGDGIRFSGNHAHAFGGAISAFASDLYLERTTFEGNSANTGGAVNYKNGLSLRVSSCRFLNNSAMSSFSSAIYVDTSTTDVVFDGVNYFERNQGRVGTVNFFYTNVIFNGINTFVNNSLTDSLGAASLSITSSSVLLNGMSIFDNNYGMEGGGLYGYLSNITIAGNCSFVRNAASLYGGGLWIRNSTLFLSGLVQFSMNQAKSRGSALYAVNSSVTIDGNVTVEHCMELQYLGFLTGSISLYDSHIIVTGHLTSRYNRASDGGSISVYNGKVDIQGCVQFLRNVVRHHGGAIFATTNSKLILRGNCTLFQFNKADQGGAIYIIDSSISFSGSHNFIQNEARVGGAIALSGSSKMMLDDFLTVNFVGNNASVGGVIHYTDAFSLSQCSDSLAQDRRECFLELSAESNIHLNFTSNTATSAGSILYGGQLGRCKLYLGGGTIDNCGNRVGGDYSENAIDTFHEISTIVDTDDSNVTSYISSDPIQICRCDEENSFDCSSEIDIKTIRGKQFPLMVVTVGQNKGIVPSSVRTSLDNGVKISPSQRIQDTKKVCTRISYRLSSETDTAKLVLFPDGPCRDTGNARLKVNINFLPCPDGFALEGSDCVCDKRLQQYTTNCSVDHNYIVRDANTFWMGTLYDNGTYAGLILHSGCPFDYCKNTAVFVELIDLDIQCAHNHSGTLCGACKANYSIALGTLHCLPCSNAYLALILPFAFAGIALVAVILLLNLSIATGTINGLIFYANIVQANGAVYFPQGATNILTVFIAWLNLDLGIETCFYDGMNSYAYTWLQFAFPFYIWFLIGLIIIACRYSNKLSNALGERKPVAALATLFLLSYSKILRTVIVALTSTSLLYPDESTKLVWIYDGNVPYFQRIDHIILGIVSILVLLLLFIPYTLLLLFGGWIQAHSQWRMLSWINKIKPFMDDNYAPYRKETRYWPGCLLLIRCALLLTFAFNIQGYASVNLLAVTSVCAAFASVAWIRNRIYTELHNDILEASFFLNLLILSVATYHVKEVGGSQVWAANVSIGVAFVTFIIILLYHIYLRLHEKAWWQKMTKLYLGKHCCFGDINDNGEEQQNGDPLQDYGTCSAPTVTTVEFREPLLEK